MTAAGRAALWNWCEGYFRRALAYETRPITLDAVREAFFRGQFDILAGARSACLLTITVISGHRNLHCFLGGGDMREMLDVLVPRAEILARELGCVAMLVDGRKGWARAMAPYGFKAIYRGPDWWLIGKPAIPRTFQERACPMSAINYTLNADYVAVATDTLAGDVADWFPLAFTLKAMFLPHLDALITSTTYLPLLRNCYNYALQAPVSDITGLSKQLPAVCRQTFDEAKSFCQSNHPPGEDHSWTDTCAVSLFGWSAEHGRLIGLRFALSKDFEPELLADGVYTNPEITGAPDCITEANALDLCEITVQQHEAEMRKLPADRNAVGGDVVLWEMFAGKDGSVVSRVQRPYRFPTYSSDAEIILGKFEAA